MKSKSCELYRIVLTCHQNLKYLHKCGLLIQHGQFCHLYYLFSFWLSRNQLLSYSHYSSEFHTTVILLPYHIVNLFQQLIRCRLSSLHLRDDVLKLVCLPFDLVILSDQYLDHVICLLALLNGMLSQVSN